MKYFTKSFLYNQQGSKSLTDNKNHIEGYTPDRKNGATYRYFCQNGNFLITVPQSTINLSLALDTSLCAMSTLDIMVQFSFAEPFRQDINMTVGIMK